MKPVTTDPNALASIVSGMGGTVKHASTFQFDLPLEKVGDVIPKLNEMGLRARSLGERIEDDPHKLRSWRTVCTIELYRDE